MFKWLRRRKEEPPKKYTANGVEIVDARNRKERGGCLGAIVDIMTPIGKLFSLFD